MRGLPVVVGVLPGPSGVPDTLHSQIHKLQAENLQIRQPPGPVPTPPLPSERAEHSSMGPGGSAHRRDRQAFSMYEPGSALKPFGAPPGDELATRLQPFHSTVSWRVELVGKQGWSAPGPAVTPTVLAPRSWRMTPSIQCTAPPAFTG